MQWIQISEKGYFGYVKDLEAIFAALGLLIGDRAQEICVKIYGPEQTDAWKSHYRFLFEAFQAIKGCNPWGLLDFLLNVPLVDATPNPSSAESISSEFSLETFTLEQYRDYLLALPEEDILWAFLEPVHPYEEDHHAKAILRSALTDDTALDQVYEWVAKDCPSFLGFSGFVRQNRRYLRDFFDLAQQMQTNELSQILREQEAQTLQLLEDTTQGVEQFGELTFSEMQLGKSFRNRGPYEEFLFLASYLIPTPACRFFHMDGTAEQARHKRQILFLSLRQTKRRREDTLKSLKAIADGTRYQILMLLAHKGPLRGLDIAREVSIATSTVSHHMDQLKEGGWITEEQVKNSKYYGLNRKNAADFLQGLSEDLELS